MTELSKENNKTKSDTTPVTFNVIIRPAEDVSGYYAICNMPNGGCNAQADTIQ